MVLVPFIHMGYFITPWKNEKTEQPPYTSAACKFTFPTLSLVTTRAISIASVGFNLTTVTQASDGPWHDGTTCLLLLSIHFSRAITLKLGKHFPPTNKPYACIRTSTLNVLFYHAYNLNTLLLLRDHPPQTSRNSTQPWHVCSSEVNEFIATDLLGTGARCHVCWGGKEVF